MKLTVTPHIAKAIKDAIKQDRNAKYAMTQGVNILTITPEEFTRRKQAFDDAEAQLLAVETLRAGDIASLDAGVLTWRPDNRPNGWRGGYAFKAKSRSGGPDHQITGAYDASARKALFSCNCIGSRYGEKCWAVKNVESYIGGTYTGGTSNRLDPSVTRLDSFSVDETFGLIPEDAS